MKVIFIYLSVILTSGLLFVNIYNSIVDARSWGANMPQSVQTARDYYKMVNPGTFYRLFSPVGQVLALLSLIFFWKSSLQIRLLLGAAFLIAVSADLLTFGYFYPRNHILFNAEISTNTEAIKSAWKQWSIMNWIRSLMVIAGLLCSVLALHKFYNGKQFC